MGRFLIFQILRPGPNILFVNDASGLKKSVVRMTEVVHRKLNPNRNVVIDD